MAFDQSNFGIITYYFNGEKLTDEVENIRGSTLYPALYCINSYILVKDDLKVDIIFEQERFKHDIPPGFMDFVEEVSLI